ncbi:MBL fold metallo-hydrolase [Rhodococcus sp. T2V]|uniref:MBL fold metallo-hydrolase n=1 Tax=Rhodococcus sp. T2V TaxID=3034164 RepID=UPI0023E0DBD4|nr:MBL fold metallo-hydrolase [Rhodococcus sp. T2V]
MPLPLDGLKAINVYVLEADDGLTVVDGGWAIPVAREQFARSLKLIGATFADIRRFLVTHVHRDHFTMAAVLGHEYGAEVIMGIEEKPALELLRDASAHVGPFQAELRAAGATELADQWSRFDEDLRHDPSHWAEPDTWIQGDGTWKVGERTIDAVHTPGHTPGHYVYAVRAEGLLFSGDHVLPSITPSIGYTVSPVDQPLGQFMTSLAKIRDLPDMRILPAHGPVAPSTHDRADELLAFHESRLALCLTSLRNRGLTTSLTVARDLKWTRHERAFDSLDVFNQGMAAMETKAHLEELVARDLAAVTDLAGRREFEAMD